MVAHRWILFLLLICAAQESLSAGSLSVAPAGREGFDVRADGRLVAPVRLSTNGVIVASLVQHSDGVLRFSGLRCRDPRAVSFAPDDYVSVQTRRSGPLGPVVRFRFTTRRFDARRWRALFRGGPAPFHFLSCSLPTAQVWHQRGWLNATPNADPFPLLLDTHVGSPEISCKWNRNWSYICPLGAHPIPVIGAWDPGRRLYIGYDFQEARATDQSERYVATAYCWRQGRARSFITLAFPHGGRRYGELLYPRPGQRFASRFHLVVDTNLPDTEDPNERFQARLFAQYRAALPRVPARSDLAWLPGGVRLRDFAGPIGLELWGPGGETTFYPAGTVLVHGWFGHVEMPIEAALRRGDTAAVESARERLDALLRRYAKRVTVAEDPCLFWEKPLEGAWHPDWGGPPVTTLHNTDAWYPARVLVELYRYDRSRGRPDPEHLRAIDGIFNWTKHFVWTRNEFADVPSSPFAIGGTLSVAFLLDYYFTFRDDPARSASAALALRLARNVTWRYLPIWAMDSDRADGNLDSAFLIEPNSGRDWAGLACANEVHWNLDTLTQAYVHTGDPRMRYYLRGILGRWPALYRDSYEDSITDYGSDAMTEGLGFFDGCGPGRGERYTFGVGGSLPLLEPVGNSKLRVVAGARACITFCKDGTHSDVADYRTDGRGACSFRLVSALPGAFDVSVSYPYVDISRLPVRVLRGGRQAQVGIRRPAQSPSSLYLSGVRHGDRVAIGSPPARLRPVACPAPLTHTGAPPGAEVRGAYRMLPLPTDVALRQDWSDLDSFAGLPLGERWAYGVPYRQGARATRRPIRVDAGGAHVLFLAFAPGPDSDAAPTLVLDNGTRVHLSRPVAPAWRAWPPCFRQVVLLGRGTVPASRTVRGVDPGSALLMAVTAFDGPPAALRTTLSALAASAAIYARQLHTRRQLLVLRQRFAPLPEGRIAVLPMPTSGAASNFLSLAGLRRKCVRLSDEQLVDPDAFNARRFPIALYLGGEAYPRTVRSPGDGKEAIRRYLAEGGTLVLLASGPFPFYYGHGPGGAPGGADPLLPELGVPIGMGFEQAPPGLEVIRWPGHDILPSLPDRFPFPPGDPRLRPVDRERLDPAHRYTPLLSVMGRGGRSYGDAACYLELGAGPARGGRVLYVWSTLISSPQGNALLSDAMAWILERTFR